MEPRRQWSPEDNGAQKRRKGLPTKRDTLSSIITYNIVFMNTLIAFAWNVGCAN